MSSVQRKPKKLLTAEQKYDLWVRMAGSTTAWLRWNSSAATVLWSVLVMKAWCRQLGHSRCCAVSARRVRRTTKRTLRRCLPRPVV